MNTLDEHVARIVSTGIINAAHTRVRKQGHINCSACVYVFVFVYVYMFVFVFCVYVCVCACVCVFVCACVDGCVWTYTCSQM